MKSFNINIKLISQEAIEIIKQLKKNGYEAFLVGGCIRDLLLERTPKDFDIATNALPDQVHKIFKSSRIIGRRFIIVHIRLNNQIYEITTFRKKPKRVTKMRNGVVLDNDYGTIEQDAERRDFTMNAIYFDPIKNKLFDFYSGVEDIKNKTINFIGPYKRRIIEDPIRILRAIRFSAKLNFKISAPEKQLLNHLYLLREVPASRIFDELMKFFLTGHGYRSLKILQKFKLLNFFFPFADEATIINDKVFITGLQNTDTRVKNNKNVHPGFFLAILLWQDFKTKYTFSNKIENHKLTDNIENFFKTNNLLFTNNRFVEYVTEVWKLQPLFLVSKPRSIYRLSNHPRFRAAYDFLLLRCSAEEENSDIATWWTAWQEVDESSRKIMLDNGIVNA